MIIPPQIKIAIAAGVVILSFGGGVFATYKYMKPQIKTLEGQVATCQDANKANDTIIRNLQDEVVKAQKSCESRLLSAHETIRRIQQIDSLQAGKGESHETGTFVGDDILRELNGMYP